jgi:hypothetical protein
LVLFVSSFLGFIINGYLILSNTFLACINTIVIFHSWYGRLYRWVFKQLTNLNPWNKQYLVMVYNSFYVLMNSICKHFVKDFCICICDICV